MRKCLGARAGAVAAWARCFAALSMTVRYAALPKSHEGLSLRSFAFAFDARSPGLRRQAIVAAIVCALALILVAPNFIGDAGRRQWPAFLPAAKVALETERRHVTVELDLRGMRTAYFGSVANRARALLAERGIAIEPPLSGPVGFEIRAATRALASAATAMLMPSGGEVTLPDLPPLAMIAADRGVALVRFTLSPAGLHALDARLTARAHDQMRRQVACLGLPGTEIIGSGRRFSIVTPTFDDGRGHRIRLRC